jgi:hypothetical protein
LTVDHSVLGMAANGDASASTSSSTFTTDVISKITRIVTVPFPLNSYDTCCAVGFPQGFRKPRYRRTCQLTTRSRPRETMRTQCKSSRSILDINSVQLLLQTIHNVFQISLQPVSGGRTPLAPWYLTSLPFRRFMSMPHSFEALMQQPISNDL